MLDKIMIINTGGTIGMVHSDENDPIVHLDLLMTGMK